MAWTWVDAAGVTHDTPVCYIDAAGIHRPALSDCIAYYTAKYQGVYGSDVYLGSDSQDGEWLGLQASAIDDANAMCVAAYNGFSPATAQGANLASVVKTNGITKGIASFSSVPLIIGGPQGTTINNGLVTDPAGNVWALPASVVIPSSGQITVTAICATLGAITAAPGTVWSIKTQTRGWQTATNTANATPGAPVETDAALRIRQSNSVMLPSNTMLGGIVGAVSAIPGVARLRAYQNDTNAPDSNGIPGHSIALVVDGGDAQTIANAIAGQKFAAGTYGTTTKTVVDQYGIPHSINYFSPTEPVITWAVTLNPFSNFSTNTNALIQASLAAFTNALGIGNGIQLNRAFSAGYLATSIAAAAAALQTAVASGNAAAIATATAAFTNLSAAANTYEITSLTVARDGNALSAADVTMAFNEAPLCVASGVSVTP